MRGCGNVLLLAGGHGVARSFQEAQLFTGTKKTLASGLIDIGAIKFGAFRLKLHDQNPNAPLSPLYVDLRILRSFPETMDSAIEIYGEMARGLTFDVYADVPTAATPFAAILSHRTRVPLISPRKGEKQHGVKGSIDGVFKEGQVALLVDDLITRAESKLEAIAVLEENGLKVQDVVVLVDREQGGTEELRKRGYFCHSAFKLRDLLEFYLDSGEIDQDQYRRSMAYLESNPG